MDVVHAERIAAPHETQEVIHIAAIVAVVKRNASGMNAFVLQDCGVTLTGAIGGIGVGAYGNSGRFAGPSGRAQTYFLEGRQLFADDTYFDYTGLTAVPSIPCSISFVKKSVRPAMVRDGIDTPSTFGGKNRWPVLAIILSPDFRETSWRKRMSRQTS